MTSFGPFSLRVAIAAAAVLLAWIAANLLSRRRALAEDAGTGGPLLDAVLAGLLAARLGYVLRWWPEYAAAPASIIAIGDGGFAWWSGLPVALATAWWRSRRAPALRGPVIAGLLIGTAGWWMAASALDAHQRDSIPLPALSLHARDGALVRIPDADPRPIVINLWATWCPPCRREMPMFASAGTRWPQVRFLLVNQGDPPELVEDYLRRSGL
ncbi:MAG: TlpA disulfide reductase family protein, partial [Chiayiivirga sp.]|nr:TlpA disulfide reductase family protein [Chiayiivirga sp.]